MHEDELISWLRKRLGSTNSIKVGAGPDDCAFFDVANIKELAVSCDMFLEGSHWDGNATGGEVGCKTFAASLSDLAASGCRPLGAVVSAGLRRGIDGSWLKDFAEGMIDCSEEFACPIVGGDTTSGNGPTSVSVTVFGTPFKDKPLLRNAAKPGDILVVTGELGGSILGKHLKPIPRIREIEAILADVNVNACMDISDGLAIDLNRMMKESGTGAKIYANLVPVSGAAESLAMSTGGSALSHALGDGEDFELLFTLESEEWTSLENLWKNYGFEIKITAIGEVTDSGKIIIITEGGEESILPPTGFLHDF